MDNMILPVPGSSETGFYFRVNMIRHNKSYIDESLLPQMQSKKRKRPCQYAEHYKEPKKNLIFCKSSFSFCFTQSPIKGVAGEQ